jgi:L,D-peptidoglycan transpeptidase YkuD (ErfK/YbiS/YcfS/YnhG family)
VKANHLLNPPRAARLALLGLIALVTSNAIGLAQTPWQDARQLVLVTTPDWDANQGLLQTFTKQDGKWQPASTAVPVAIGRTGSAWGIGLHEPQPGPEKREGDGRSPAGVFHIGQAFGYAPSVQSKLPYSAMSESDYCVDVSASPLYNRIVNAREAGAAAVAGSTEPMRRDIHVKGDQLYKVGFVIEHNSAGKPDAGSCIFAHLWRAPGSPTTGCTAMSEPVMLRLMAWLEPERRPIFVLLPRQEYARLKASWELPDLVSSQTN